MSNQYFNFYYSPTRQGYDSSIWKTLFGGPVVSSNRLLIQDAAILHYGDILRGDAYFNLNMAAPAIGLSKKFGFYQPNKNAYAYFYINGASFTATCSNGTTTTSVDITWQSEWTNANTEFRIRWEGGLARFYIAGNESAVINDVSVTGDPMSIYLACEAQDTLIVNFVDVKSIQSYILQENHENSVFTESYVYEGSTVSITDVPTMLMKIINTNDLTGESDVLSISENVSLLMFYPISVSDSVNVTESKTVGAPA